MRAKIEKSKRMFMKREENLLWIEIEIKWIEQTGKFKFYWKMEDSAATL